ncbi:MAG: DUF5108 domain-containing protein, partial [Prevotellaceae bacterium]|nr:DUF5108 domain-containing protein [Prevotellaceae bacterium]
EWTPEPTVVTFDVCNYPEVRNRIDTKPDMEGQKYQTSHSNDEYRTSVVDLLPPYTVQKSPSGNGAPLSTYGWLDYFTAKASSAWNDAKFHDLLILNVGYMGSVEMKTPTVIQGKYKVTLGFGYATSQKFMVDMTGGSNGGQMKFSFDDQSVTATPYTTVPSNTLGNYTYVLFDELEFSSTSTHSFKIVVMDPAASTNSNFRIYIDYLLFEPIND